MTVARAAASGVGRQIFADLIGMELHSRCSSQLSQPPAAEGMTRSMDSTRTQCSLETSSDMDLPPPLMQIEGAGQKRLALTVSRNNSRLIPPGPLIIKTGPNIQK
jgi:hypothetical protein